ncbi:MAG: hypothetical protein L0221_12280 [Chloroflexi bacterium]|nr:hypothetical protein [Chloroflexota bacterium]
MARAKRTNDRADARRRYRLAQLADDELEDGAVPGSEVGTPATTAARPAAARPSFTAAFRNAYHQANVREDLPYLPSLLRHWSFWVPLLLMIGGAILPIVAPATTVSTFVFQTFAYPPALIVLFITGFFARRASYLLGGILGVANVIVYGAFLAYAGRGGLGGEVPTEGQLEALFINAVVFSPPAGVLFCSLAAWYRRFLALTNPNRGRRPQPKARPKPPR